MRGHISAQAGREACDWGAGFGVNGYPAKLDPITLPSTRGSGLLFNFAALTAALISAAAFATLTAATIAARLLPAPALPALVTAASALTIWIFLSFVRCHFAVTVHWSIGSDYGVECPLSPRSARPKFGREGIIMAQQRNKG